MRVSRVDGVVCSLGEAPVWDEQSQSLYFVDGADHRLIRLHPDSAACQTWPLPHSPGAMALRQSGGVVLAIQKAIYTFDFASGALTRVAAADDLPDKAVFNDGRVDRQGRFVIGAMFADVDAPKALGGIYRLATDLGLARIAGDIAVSNSTCFSLDGRTLYFADSMRNTVFQYNYDIERGEVGERRVFIETQELGGTPDGATVDSEGNIWIALALGSKIVAIRPDGRLHRVVELPISIPSSLAFGGPDLDRLFITSIDPGTMPAQFGCKPETDGGRLFVIDGLGAQGILEPRFAG